MWESEPVVIVGANMAGMTAARALAGKVRAQVFDASSSIEWLPNIHELVSHGRRPQNLRLARAPILHRMGHEFSVARLSRIDWRHHRLRFDDGREVLYSRLLLALGGVNNTFGVPGAQDHALPFKSVADCQHIAMRLDQLSHQESLNVVLVGAGIEGIEALGEVLSRYHRHPGLNISVVDSADRLLPRLPPQVDARLRDHCDGLPVSFLLGRKVAQVERERVTLDDGQQIHSDLVIWTGGVAANPSLRQSSLADASGFVPVSATLQSKVSSSVYVAGDCIGLVNGQSIARQAYHAMDMGKLAARNLVAELDHRPLSDYTPVDKPQLVTFGHYDTFMVWGDRVWAGPALRSLKEAVYQAGLVQLDSRSPGRRLSGLARRLLDAGIDELISLMRSPSLLRMLRVSRLN